MKRFFDFILNLLLLLIFAFPLLVIALLVKFISSGPVLYWSDRVYHMKRSKIEFRKFFSNVIPLPSNYLCASPAGTLAVRYIPQSRWLYNNQLVFREYVGQLWYSIKDI